ncbi:hypothetical protein [Marinimicrobium sp. C2-29]|uniref:hypothetical protein n=1 Tax=Marinimicrobium sp. C2-29 TaxID=3139825 RepID=UPI003139C710
MLAILVNIAIVVLCLIAASYITGYRIQVWRVLLGALVFGLSSEITIPVPVLDSLLAPTLLYMILIGNNFQDHQQVLKLFLIALFLYLLVFYLLLARALA